MTQMWLLAAVQLALCFVRSNEQQSSPAPASTIATTTKAAQQTTTPPPNQLGGGQTANIPKCSDPANLTGLGLPQWYIEFWRAKEENVCRMPFYNWTDDFTKAVALDKETGLEVPWWRICDLNWDYARLHILADYYHSFLRLTPFPGISGTNGAPEGTPQKMTHIIIFLCSPFAFFTFMCGMYVIHKILKESDGHLFVYHAVLIFSDICCYILDSTHVTDFAQWASTPICYTNFYLAAGPFTNFVPLTWVAHESGAFGLSNLVQALLAADRALSLVAPLWYRSHAGYKMALSAIGVVFLLNTFIWAGQLALTTPWQQFLIKGTIDSSRHLPLVPIAALFGAIRAIVFVFSWLVQLVGCVIVFIKVWKLKRGRGGDKKGNGVSLMPCYLLVGTCFMNLAGCTSYSIYMVVFYIILPLQQGTIAGKVNGAQLMFVPILNNLGFYIHCVVCRQYREAVAELVIGFFGRTYALLTCTKYEPKKKGGSQAEKSVSGTGSTASKATKVSQVGPTSTTNAIEED